MTYSLGQIAWTIAGGRDPTDVLFNQFRYLRRLGIPPIRYASGRGNAYLYSFNDLIQMGIGVKALRTGFKFREIVDIFAELPADLRDIESINLRNRFDEGYTLELQPMIRQWLELLTRVPDIRPGPKGSARLTVIDGTVFN